MVVALVEPVTPELPMEALLPLAPGPPMELVLLPEVSPLVEPGVALPLPMTLVLPLLPGVLLLDVDVSRLGAGIVVDELDEDVVGVPA